MTDSTNRAPRLARLLLRAGGALPTTLTRTLAVMLATLFRWLRLREWRVTLRNLEFCLPELPAAERERLARRAMTESVTTLLESLRFWSHPAEQNLRRVIEVENEPLFHDALAAPEGVIVAAPHLGNWELLNQYLASRGPLAIVYRAPKRASLEPLLLAGRGVPGVTQVRAEPAAVRTLLKRLSAGGTLGILPDQQPKQGEGEFAPFFGVPALTMSLLPRLAARTGATVLFAYAERRPDGRFVVRFLPAEDDIRSTDTARACAALNRGVEACARRALAQYQWGYKRFSIRPEGEPKPY